MAKATGKFSLETGEKIAGVVVKRLSPYCHRIEVAGSIRRRRPRVRDIDMVAIPKDYYNFYQELKRLGNMNMSGQKILRVTVASPAGPIPLDVYVATAENWATLLLIRTGSTENNIRLCTRAQNMGWQLHANGDGLFNERGERIAGDSEESIYQALGLPYKEPWERN